MADLVGQSGTSRYSWRTERESATLYWLVFMPTFALILARWC
ncbi:MAG: hypothetical protein R3E78_04970 [Burkholderiaceae bacterium]